MLLTLTKRVVQSALLASALTGFGSAEASMSRSLLVVDRMVVEFPLGFRDLRLSEVTSKYVMAEDPAASDGRYWRYLLTTAVFEDGSSLELRWTYAAECPSGSTEVSAEPTEIKGIQCISDVSFGSVTVSFRWVFGVSSRERAANYMEQVTIYIDGGSGGVKQLLETGAPVVDAHPAGEGVAE